MFFVQLLNFNLTQQGYGVSGMCYLFLFLMDSLMGAWTVTYINYVMDKSQYLTHDQGIL